MKIINIIKWIALPLWVVVTIPLILLVYVVIFLYWLQDKLVPDELKEKK